MKFLHAVKTKIKKILIYLSGRLALDNVPDIAATEGLQCALTYLQKTYRFYKPVAIRYWILLYEYLIQLDKEKLSCDLAPESFIVHFCCWGSEYVDKAKNYLLTSLNTQGNLQNITTSREVIIMIHCDQMSKQLLADSSIVQKLQKTIRIIFFVLPQTLLDTCYASYHYPNLPYLRKMNNVFLNHKYYLLGGLQTHALKIALCNKAYISFMMPDFVLSDSFFQYAFAKIKNKTLIVTTTFRTNYNRVKKEMDSYIKDLNLSITATKLTQLQIENMHYAAKRRIVSESTKDFTPSAQLIFESSKGYVIRAFHYHPILLDCAKIEQKIPFDYRAVDYILLNHLLKKELSFEKQLWVCDNSSYMAMMELSEDYIENSLNKGESPTYAELLDQIKKMMIRSPEVYNTPLNQYFSSIRHQFVSEKLFDHKKVYIDDLSFFKNLQISTTN